jgi:hypothetical protein
MPWRARRWTPSREGERLRLTLPLPAALVALGDEALFHASAQAITDDTLATPWAGMFGTGFALRLAGAEARAAGGWLERRAGALLVDLPGLASVVPMAPQGRTATSPAA